MFYLGIHHPGWMERLTVPVCVSRRILVNRKRPLHPTCSYVLDSGAFTELSLHGRWTVGADDFAASARSIRDRIPGMEWAAIQDWMCDPQTLRATGQTASDHIRLTVANYLRLLMIAPGLPWLPVIQGWTIREYRSCVALYRAEGIDLRALPVVGLGSICSRQGGEEVAMIARWLHWEGLKLHGFGLKTKGIRRAAPFLASADSMAWSYQGRRSPALPGHTHKSCANCLEYALRWRSRLLAGKETAMNPLICGQIAS